jgi:hypothetical protein
LYTYSSKKLVLMAAVAVLIGLAVVQGVVLQTGMVGHEGYTTGQGLVVWGGNESNPSSPIRIKLGISVPPALGKTAELLAVISSAMDASNVEAHIEIPNGFVVTAGNAVNWKGSVAHDQGVQLRYTIKSVQVGDWIIEGSVKWNFGEGSFYTDTDRICMVVSENSAYVTTKTLSQTTGLPSGNETNPPTESQLVPGGISQLPPNTQIVMFVSPTLVQVGIETTITISYAVASTPGKVIAPGVMIRGGAPSFEGPVIVTYGPVLDRTGEEWIAKILPISAGLVKVNGQDESGSVHVYAEINVVNTLPPPEIPPSFESVPKQYDSARWVPWSVAVILPVIVTVFT